MTSCACLRVADTISTQWVARSASVQRRSLIVTTLAGLKTNTRCRQLVWEVRVADDAAKFVSVKARGARGVTLDAIVTVVVVAGVAIRAADLA